MRGVAWLGGGRGGAGSGVGLRLRVSWVVAGKGWKGRGWTARVRARAGACPLRLLRGPRGVAEPGKGCPEERRAGEVAHLGGSSAGRGRGGAAPGARLGTPPRRGRGGAGRSRARCAGRASRADGPFAELPEAQACGSALRVGRARQRWESGGVAG